MIRLSPLVAVAALAGVVASAPAPTPAWAQSGASVSVSVPQLEPSQAGSRAASTTADQLPGAGAAEGRRGRSDLVSAPTQIGDARPTAEAAPPLSSRAQGRSVAVGAVGGSDRCDAADAADTPLCRGRLEARAGAYDKPGAAPVTPEARLLILADPQPQPQTVNEATRRLGGAPGVDALAGGAASELAGAISGSGGDPSARAASTAAGAAAASTALPAGVPSVVLTPH